MRMLARLSIDAQVHSEIVRIRNFIGGDDPWSQRAEGINAFAEAEDAGFHLAALDITRSNIIENHVTPNVVAGFFWGEVFTGLLQYHREFELVIQFLLDVFGINQGLAATDVGLDVLAERDQWPD